MVTSVLHGLLYAAALVGGQDDAPQSAPPPAQSPPDIVVTGDREEMERTVRAITRKITERRHYSRPLPRFQVPVCVATVGLRDDYKSLIRQRIGANLAAADIPVDADPACRPNALVVFAADAQKAVREMAKEQPWLLSGYSNSEKRDLTRHKSPTYAWQTTQLRGADGKPLKIMILELPPYGEKKEVIVNEQGQTGRTNQPIREDITGAVVVIDNHDLPGKTIEQLADYATMRLVATTRYVQDAGNDAGNDAPAIGEHTILSLFATPDIAPEGLTDFDRGYLMGLYRLRANAPVTALQDAASKAFRELSE